MSEHSPDFPKGVAVVIGGSGGLGSAIAIKLAASGCDVALTYRTHAHAGEAVADSVRALGQRASAHALALTNEDAVHAFMAEVADAYGNIHTLVHAAGSAIDQPYASQVTGEQWRAVLDADVNGLFYTVQSALPYLKSHLQHTKLGGSMVYLSSAGLLRYPTGDVLSTAPKAANEAFLRAIAKEEGRFGVRANVLALGVIDAGMFPKLVASGELDQAYLDASKKNIALKRFGTSEEVADAAVFLASRRAQYITGQTLALDGGYSI